MNWEQFLFSNRLFDETKHLQIITLKFFKFIMAVGIVLSNK